MWGNDHGHLIGFCPNKHKIGGGISTLIESQPVGKAFCACVLLNVVSSIQELNINFSSNENIPTYPQSLSHKHTNPKKKGRQ